MSDENAYIQATQEYGAVIRTLIPERISGLKVQPESPIERAFLVGLISMSYTVPCYDFGDTFSEHALNKAGKFPVVTVELQAPIENYRADFLLTVHVRGEMVGRVVIECDGHAFHERTKEQAARDRSRDRVMTLAGYTVLRFTGSELHRDLMSCVVDAHTAAWNYYLKSPV